MYIEDANKAVVEYQEDKFVNFTALINLLLEFLTKLFEKYLPEEIK